MRGAVSEGLRRGLLEEVELETGEGDLPELKSHPLHDMALPPPAHHSGRSFC